MSGLSAISIELKKGRQQGFEGGVPHLEFLHGFGCEMIDEFRLPEWDFAWRNSVLLAAHAQGRYFILHIGRQRVDRVNRRFGRLSQDKG